MNTIEFLCNYIFLLSIKIKFKNISKFVCSCFSFLYNIWLSKLLFSSIWNMHKKRLKNIKNSYFTDIWLIFLWKFPQISPIFFSLNTKLLTKIDIYVNRAIFMEIFREILWILYRKDTTPLFPFEHFQINYENIDFSILV